MTLAEFIEFLYTDGLHDEDEIVEVHWSGQHGLHVVHTKRNDQGQITISD